MTSYVKEHLEVCHYLHLLSVKSVVAGKVPKAAAAHTWASYPNLEWEWGSRDGLPEEVISDLYLKSG